MSELLSSITKGSSGASFIMPVSAAQGINITMKSAGGAFLLSTSASFWAKIDDNAAQERMGYQGVSLSTAANTDEQTIMDLSGQSGVLTQVLCPELSASGIVTVRVTIDGVTTVFTSPTLPFAARRFCIGGFLWSASTTSASDGAGDGSALDYGWDSAQWLLMTTPVQSLKYRIGMPFTSSCKVTVQCSVNPETGEFGKAAACHTTTALAGV